MPNLTVHMIPDQLPLALAYRNILKKLPIQNLADGLIHNFFGLCNV